MTQFPPLHCVLHHSSISFVLNGPIALQELVYGEYLDSICSVKELIISASAVGLMGLMKVRLALFLSRNKKTGEEGDEDDEDLKVGPFRNICVTLGRFTLIIDRIGGASLLPVNVFSVSMTTPPPSSPSRLRVSMILLFASTVPLNFLFIVFNFRSRGLRLFVVPQLHLILPGTDGDMLVVSLVILRFLIGVYGNILADTGPDDNI